MRVAKDSLSTDRVLPPWGIPPAQLPAMRPPHLPQEPATGTFCTAPTLLLEGPALPALLQLIPLQFQG